MGIYYVIVEHDTVEKPEILAIAQEMAKAVAALLASKRRLPHELAKTLALGACVRTWTWFDKQMVDGRVRATPDMLDLIVGCAGFADALCAVGWLRVREGSLEVPNHERRMGQSAKQRALNTLRQRRLRDMAVSGGSGSGSPCASLDTAESATPARHERDTSAKTARQNHDQSEARSEARSEAKAFLDEGVPSSCSTVAKSATVEPEDEPKKVRKRKPFVQPEDVSPVVAVIPCNGKTRSWRLHQARIDAWQAVFPDLDVQAECKRAIQYTLDTRKKTASGMAKFLYGWLARSNDRVRAPDASPVSNGRGRADVAQMIASLNLGEGP